MTSIIFPIILFSFYGAVITTDIRLPPKITVNPKPLIYYQAGEVIILECLAQGYPKPEYEWYLGDKAISIPGHNGNYYHDPPGTLKIDKIQQTDNGTYHCRASNLYGTALSSTSILEFAFIYSFSEKSVLTRELEEGKAAALECKEAKSNPKPSHFWALEVTQRNKDEQVILTKRIQIDEKGWLHFGYILQSDHRDDQMYKCQSKNVENDITIGGSYTKIKVIPKAHSHFSPTIKFKSDDNLIAIENRNILIRCFFSAYPEASVSWSKYKITDKDLTNQIRLAPDRSSITNFNTILEITNIKSEDEGIYICTGKNEYGSQIAKTFVNIEAGPEFKSDSDRVLPRNVTEGDSVEFKCNPYAKPAATVKWLKNGYPLITENDSKWVMSADKRTLTLRSACRDDCRDPVTNEIVSSLMVLQCIAENKWGKVMVDGYLNVLKKTKILKWPNDCFFNKGTYLLDVSFECDGITDDLTPLKFEWRYTKDKSIEPILLLPVHNKIYFTENNQILNIHVNNMSEWDVYNGFYRCDVSNGYSKEMSNLAQLKVEDIVTEAPVTEMAVESASSLWWVLLIVLLILILLMLILCVCFCCWRNRGDEYKVDQKERKNGNDPIKELKQNGFHDYQRPSGEGLRGSRASLGSSIKMDSDDEGSLNEYGDIDAGKFGEDGSFIGDYSTENRRHNHTNHFQNHNNSYNRV